MKWKTRRIPPIDENGVERPRNVNEWMNMKKPPKGYSIGNAKFKKEYHDYYKEFSKWAYIFYVIGIRGGNHYVLKMMNSCKDQADFCAAVCGFLNENEVTKDYFPFFNKDSKLIRTRLERVALIAKENAWLTEYWPFFESIGGVDCVAKFETADEFADAADAWNKEHQADIKSHMQKIQPEIIRHNEFLRRKVEAIKSEKAEEKAKKRQENAEIKEMRENARKHRAEYKKIERSFERYYQGRA